MTKMGFVDPWTSLSRGFADGDVGNLHGKNPGLNRCDVHVVDSDNFAADGEAYMKGLIVPFEKSLTQAGVTIRGLLIMPIPSYPKRN